MFEENGWRKGVAMTKTKYVQSLEVCGDMLVSMLERAKKENSYDDDFNQAIIDCRKAWNQLRGKKQCGRTIRFTTVELTK